VLQLPEVKEYIERLEALMELENKKVPPKKISHNNSYAPLVYKDLIREAKVRTT
jgi:hypothetical protein